MLQRRLDAQNVKATVPTSSLALEGTIDIICALMVQRPVTDQENCTVFYFDFEGQL